MEIKYKVHLEQTTKAQMGSRGIALLLFFTSTLDGVGGECHALTALHPDMTRYPLCRRLDGSQGRYGRVRKISPLPRFDPRTVQPVVCCYPGPQSPYEHVYNSE